jgi:hypothetical protein
MKSKILSFLVLALFPFFLQSCFKDKCEREITYIKTTPIYKTASEIRSGIDFQAPRLLEKPGKMYFYNDYIFINEQREGVHIINNTNPEAPANIGFIEIPGNVDIAIRNNILFADNYIDLLTININDVNNPQLINRNEDVFPHYGETSDGFLVYFHTEEVTEIVDCETQNGRFRDDVFLGAPEIFTLDNSSGGNQSGVGGSLARFALYDNYLYSIDNSNLHVFDISDLTTPNEVNNVSVGWQIETLFSYTDKLFIGSTTGMIIMDAADPSLPTYLSSYSHFWGCDPVVVKDDYAYVTLRSGSNCQQNGDQLDLVNISDITNPYVEKTFPMENPYGLGIKENTLFLCEGKSGLKVFDIETPTELDKNLIDHETGLMAYDVIPLPGNENILLLIGEDGFYQYNFDDPNNLKLLSHIAINK